MDKITIETLKQPMKAIHNVAKNVHNGVVLIKHSEFNMIDMEILISFSGDTKYQVIITIVDGVMPFIKCEVEGEALLKTILEGIKYSIKQWNKSVDYDKFLIKRKNNAK